MSSELPPVDLNCSDVSCWRPKLEPGHGPVVGRIQHVMEVPLKRLPVVEMSWLLGGERLRAC